MRGWRGSIGDPMLADVLERHVDEALFLWRQRELAVCSPQIRLVQLLRFDERLDANLDAIWEAGPSATLLLETAAARDAEAATFARALIALAADERRSIERALVSAVGTPRLERAFGAACGWLPFESVSQLLQRWSQSFESALVRIACVAFGHHRYDPGAILDDALNSEEAAVRASALRTCAEVGRASILPRLRASANDPDPICRFESLWAQAVLASSADVSERLLELLLSKAGARAGAGRLRRAIAAAAPRLPAPRILQLLAAPATARLGLDLAAAAGWVETLPALLECTTVPHLARRAAHAFAQIVGADLGSPELRTAAPSDFDAGPNDDPADPNVALDPDEGLPWPNVPALRAGWTAHQSQLGAGGQYLLGKQVSAPWCSAVLRDGPQAARHAAAGFRAAEGQHPIFNTRAPSFRQLELLRT